MPFWIRLTLALLLLLGGAEAARSETRPDPVLLVSLDGMRPDYLERGRTPALNAMAAGGVRAEAMRPSFPANTFPNHYTLVTGLRPDRHGVIDNTMTDPARPGVTFSMGARDQVRDRFWWDGATPIWVTAERAGLRTAPMSWPGVDAGVLGVPLWSAMGYDETVTYAARVDQVLAWLSLPPAERPVFVTLYLDSLDVVAHRQGPDSVALDEALSAVDATMARLLEGLKARGLAGSVNVIVVSDHGMAPTAPERVVVLDELFGPGSFRWVTLGTTAGLIPTNAAAEARIVGAHDNVTCWRKADIPARYAFGGHRRVPPVFCLARTGWTLSTRQRLTQRPITRPGGSHGYDPYDPLMQAVFLARGPAFRQGVVLPAFDNVSVYPLLATLLGLKPEPNDGRLADTAAALR